MSKRRTKKDIINYVFKAIDKGKLSVIYNDNDIQYQKCELYNDYVQSLMCIIFDTYMGDEVTNDGDQKKHFKWCWEQNHSKFKKEGIDIKSNKLYEYFLEFMIEIYYTSNDNQNINNVERKLVRLWDAIFDYDGEKTYSEVDSLVEIYHIFEKSMKNS